MRDYSDTPIALELEDRLSPTECAAFLGLSPQTLRSWRSRGIGPPFYRISRCKIFYVKAEVIAWLSTRRVRPRA